jgi:hypothetical protein
VRARRKGGGSKRLPIKAPLLVAAPFEDSKSGYYGRLRSIEFFADHCDGLPSGLQFEKPGGPLPQSIDDKLRWLSC